MHRVFVPLTAAVSIAATAMLSADPAASPTEEDAQIAFARDSLAVDDTDLHTINRTERTISRSYRSRCTRDVERAPTHWLGNLVAERRIVPGRMAARDARSHHLASVIYVPVHAL